MKLSKERIQTLSNEIAQGLAERGFISPSLPEAQVASKVADVLAEDQAAEARLDAQAREMMKTYETQIRQGEADFHRMFLLIKKKLAKDRGFVL